MFDLTGIDFLSEEFLTTPIPVEISFMIGIIILFIGLIFLWNAYKSRQSSFKKFKEYGE